MSRNVYDVLPINVYDRMNDRHISWHASIVDHVSWITNNWFNVGAVVAAMTILITHKQSPPLILDARARGRDTYKSLGAFDSRCINRLRKATLILGILNAKLNEKVWKKMGKNKEKKNNFQEKNNQADNVNTEFAEEFEQEAEQEQEQKKNK